MKNENVNSDIALTQQNKFLNLYFLLEFSGELYAGVAAILPRFKFIVKWNFSIKFFLEFTI